MLWNLYWIEPTRFAFTFSPKYLTIENSQECSLLNGTKKKKKTTGFPFVHEQELSPVLAVGCGNGGTITLFIKNTSNTPHLSWWHRCRDVTFTAAQCMYCVLTKCTRTPGPHVEKVINHATDGLFPPWSGKERHGAVSVTFLCPAIGHRGEWAQSCGGGQTVWHPSCSFWIQNSRVLIYNPSGALTTPRPWLEDQLPCIPLTRDLECCSFRLDSEIL